MRTATVQEAINGNNNETVITPLRLKQVLSELDLSSGGGGSGGITKETDPIFKSSPAAGITTSNIASWNAKQNALVSGQTIKTINGQDILGEGDITIESGSSSDTPEVFIGASTPKSGEKVWFQPLGNLFNKETVLHTGYFLDSGKFYNHSNWVTSDYIEVRPNEQYTYSGYKFVPNDVNGIISNVYYDADKKLISTIPRNAKKGTLTIPSNAHYIRFSIYDYSNEELNELNSFQFEKGSVATSYKPYSTKQSINILNGTVYEEFLNVDNLLTKDDNIIIEESDPTVPAHVKAITQEDIDNWNSGTGGGGTGGSDYELPVATGETLGGIKIGSNLHITEDGVLSAISDEVTGDGSFDPVPINSIFDYEGDVVPEGFVEVEEEEGDLFFYKPGDVFATSVPLTLHGIVTSSTKRLVFSVVLPKRLDNITTINCTRFNAELRGQSGYINNASGYKEYTEDTNYKITCAKATDNMVSIYLDKSTAYTNVTNNTLVALRINVTFEFN